MVAMMSTFTLALFRQWVESELFLKSGFDRIFDPIGEQKPLMVYDRY